MIKSTLLDARTPQDVWDRALEEVRGAVLLGLDCETQDEARHAGLNAFNTKKRHVFDHRRTTMTGFSFYADGSDTAWYVNLAHDDFQNRLPFHKARVFIDAIPEKCITVAHNAPFELVMFEQCHSVKLNNLVCTLQMAVSHHGPDEYTVEAFAYGELDAMRKHTKSIQIEYAAYDPETRGQSLTSEQAELLNMFVGKESKAEHSYNGFVKSISHGYNLKRLTKSKFGVDQMSFDQVLKLGNAKHMGELTGEQVCAYGADDAYWAVEHYKWLLADMAENNLAALESFVTTENPMVQVYAECWRDGLRLDLHQVFARQGTERVAMAQLLRKAKVQIKSLLPFPAQPPQALIEKQEWYAKHWQTKRKQIEAWANSPDSDDDFAQCLQVSNPVGNAWAIEKGITPPKGGLNLLHYYGMRTLLYDLMDHRLVYADGEVSSDKDARARMLKTFEKAGQHTHVDLLKTILDMAELEQRLKLYITPYTQLMDPETSRVYATISSMLATRRMAMSNPNGMQLAKRGSSKYVRGFFEADEDDHLIVGADWSSVELVLVGDASGDPAFGEVFGQLPYGDLHSGAAADCLAVAAYPGLSETEFLGFKLGLNPNNRELRDLDGQVVSPDVFYKVMRTEIGKAANFNFWFSGSLSTVGGLLGWSSDTMWEATDKYKKRFAVAEEWRVNVGKTVSEYGYVELPDGHRRVRFEATDRWAQGMRHKFANLSNSQSMQNYGDLVIKRLQSRARNQAVNAMIQGTCATLAKRSILRLRDLVKEHDLDRYVRFMMPIHDELLYSVQRDHVMKFIPLLRQAMTEHPTIMKTLPLDCTVAIGRTFLPYDGSAKSQIELDEATPVGDVIPLEFKGKKLPDDLVEKVINYIGDDQWKTTLKAA